MVGVLGIVATTRPFNGTIVVVSGSTMPMGHSSWMLALTNFHIPLRSAMESRTILGPSCETVGVLGISAAMRPLNGMIVVASGLGILNCRSSCTLTVPDTSMPSRVSMGSSCATAEGSQTAYPSSSTRTKPLTLENTETILRVFCVCEYCQTALAYKAVITISYTIKGIKPLSGVKFYLAGWLLSIRGSIHEPIQVY